MSVDFCIKDEHYDVEAPQDHSLHINLCNANARELLDWLEIAHEDLFGQIKGTELAAKCRRRLWDEARNHDPAKEGEVTKTPGQATLINCGREEDYLRFRTQWLLAMAERAGERMVHFG